MYDKPFRKTYSWNAVDLHTADLTRVLKNPVPGSKGKVVGIEVAVTTTCAGATTTPKVQCGDGTTANKYGELACGTTAAGTSIIAKNDAGGLKTTVPTASDGDITVTFKAATGAGAAGAGDVFITVEWF